MKNTELLATVSDPAQFSVSYRKIIIMFLVFSTSEKINRCKRMKMRVGHGALGELRVYSTEVVKEAEFLLQGVPLNLKHFLNPSDLYNVSIWSNVLRKRQ